MNETQTETTHPNVVEGKNFDQCSSTAASSTASVEPFENKDHSVDPFDDKHRSVDPFDNKDHEYLQSFRNPAEKQQQPMSPKTTDPPPGKDEGVLASLALSESKLEKVESIIEQEVQLRLQVKLLEMEAEAKKLAAEKALQAAMEALHQITGESQGGAEEEEPQQPVKPGENSINGKIDAISAIISTASKEAVSEDEEPEAAAAAAIAEAEAKADAIVEANAKAEADAKAIAEAEADAKEKAAAAAELEAKVHAMVISVENDVAAVASPPAIVRQTEVPPEETEEVPDDVTPNASNKYSKETEEEETKVVTLEVVTSNLTMDDGIASPRNNSVVSPYKDHTQTMEDTLDTMVTKVEECAEILRSPTASAQEQIKAAELAAQYAKAVKAFQKAL